MDPAASLSVSLLPASQPEGLVPSSAFHGHLHAYVHICARAQTHTHTHTPRPAAPTSTGLASLPSSPAPQLPLGIGLSTGDNTQTLSPLHNYLPTPLTITKLALAATTRCSSATATNSPTSANYRAPHSILFVLPQLYGGQAASPSLSVSELQAVRGLFSP